MQLQNQIPSMAGAGAGTVTGFPLGKAVEYILSSKYLPNSSLTRTVFGSGASGVMQECVDNKVKDALEK